MFKLSYFFLIFGLICELQGHNSGINSDKFSVVWVILAKRSVKQYWYEKSLSLNIKGHIEHALADKNKILSDADLQSALMPQELNPAIVFDKDAPWRAVFPLDRQRRDLEIVADTLPLQSVSPLSQNLKLYSRVATFVALALGAFIEVILYIVEYYFVV